MAESDRTRLAARARAKMVFLILVNLLVW